VDVGTTKLACYLVELETGRVLATGGAMNPQLSYGEDVISRLKAAMDDLASASKIQQMVVEAINAISSELCTAQGLATERLLDICLVGNTAMHHLLLGLPVRALAVSPFVPATTSSLEVYASLLELHTAPGAYAYLPAPIAGFVGSDHLAVLLAAGFGDDNRTRIAIDIGTNTEIALQAGGKIVSCSTASGPAFEGAHISQGMRAAPGAIQRVHIDTDDTVHRDVIGNVPAIGICGSGVLDAIAVVGEAARPRLGHHPHLGQLGPLPLLRDRAHDVDVGLSRLASLAVDVLDVGLTLNRGIRVGHADDGGESGRHRRRRAAGNRLFLLIARFA
jgi:uncharacterized 2Fe-2S/4Fe-4S cluster protein (DUF4445 family)